MVFLNSCGKIMRVGKSKRELGSVSCFVGTTISTTMDVDN